MNWNNYLCHNSEHCNLLTDGNFLSLLLPLMLGSFICIFIFIFFFFFLL